MGVLHGGGTLELSEALGLRTEGDGEDAMDVKMMVGPLALMLLASGCAAANERGGRPLPLAGIDVDGNGVVTWEEFRAARPDRPEARVRQVFQSLDANRDGVLSESELQPRSPRRPIRGALIADSSPDSHHG